MKSAPRSEKRSDPGSGEEGIIKRVRRLLDPDGPGRPLRIAIGDDAAVWQPRAGYETVVTCDWFLEGTHFEADRHPPHAVGWKCLARALSDLAAMGATPRCFLLSLALPHKRTGAWLDQFLRGLRAAARRFGCPAAGGDTTRRQEVLINITPFGECLRGRAVLRSGARRGDAILVSGALGEAEYGLELVRQGRGVANRHEPRLRKHLYPEPRLAIGAWLAERGLATAMMDLSDGLSVDLPRLCHASGVGAQIEESRLPLARPSGVTKRSALKMALHGGEDYELLFTVAKRNVPRIPPRLAGVRLSPIGEITSDGKIALVGPDGRLRELPRMGWDPFERNH